MAHRRAAALVQAGARVTVIAPCVESAIAELDVTIQRRVYKRGDLAGAALVVVATDCDQINQAAADEAKHEGALVNRADDPDQGDVVVPAHAHHGPITIAVSTSGVSAAAAAVIRRQLCASLDPDWPRLLEIAAPYRVKVQERVDDPSRRTACLRQLTDPRAMALLKAAGPQRLRDYFQEQIDAARRTGDDPTHAAEGSAASVETPMVDH